MDFLNKLAGKFSGPISDTLLNYQLYNPRSPKDLQNVGGLFGSFLGKGAFNLQDETGRASINPMTGEFELMGKNFGIGLNPNQFDLSAQLKFQFGKTAEDQKPATMMSQFLQEEQRVPSQSAGRQALDQQLQEYMINNPNWYRP